MAERLPREERWDVIERSRSGAVHLTAPLIDRVCSRIENNGYHAVDCLVEVGVSRAWASRWLRRGEELEQEAARALGGTHDEACLSLVAGVHFAEAKVLNRWQMCWTDACVEASKTGKGAGATAWEKRIVARFPDSFKKPVAPSAPSGSVWAQLEAAEASTQVGG